MFTKKKNGDAPGPLGDFVTRKSGLGLSNFFFSCVFSISFMLFLFLFLLFLLLILSFFSFSLFLFFSVSFFVYFFFLFSFSFSFYFALNLEKQNHFFYSKRAPIPAKTEVLHEKLKTVLPMVILKFIFSSSNFTKF